MVSFERPYTVGPFMKTIMRMMDNCTLDPEPVKNIQDDISYYVDSNQVSKG